MDTDLRAVTDPLPVPVTLTAVPTERAEPAPTTPGPRRPVGDAVAASLRGEWRVPLSLVEFLA